MPTHAPRRSTAPITLSDLTADLIWPKLLRAGHLALRPSRLGMAMVFVIGALFLGALANHLGGGGKTDSGVVATSTRHVLLDFAAAPGGGEIAGERGGRQLADAFLGEPFRLLREQPWVALVAFPLLLGWTAVTGGAICRSAAGDFAQSVSISWPQAARFALARWRSLILALVLPLLIVWAIALGMAVAGWTLFSAPVLNLIGAAAWPVFLFGGVVAAIVIVAFTVGWPLLVPSVACEGTDAVDAVQHAYSFVFGRPLRLIVYLLLLFVQLVLLAGLIAVICWLGIHIAQRCALAWSGERGLAVLGRLPQHMLENAPEQTTGTSVPARWIAALWTLLPAMLPLAFVVSFFWSGSTMLYLAMRRVVDGQDMGEIWMPGVIEGTMAADAPAPTTSAAADAKGEGISEAGPADDT